MSEITEINIKAGQMTYGQRIELGSILSAKGISNWTRCERCMRCLYPEWNGEYYEGLSECYERIIAGIEYWINRENTELHHEPSADEVKAGCKELARELGPMSTITALASKYGQDPNNIIGWKYGQVFNCLYTDLKNYKFAEKIRKLQERKHKAKYKK